MFGKCFFEDRSENATQQDLSMNPTRFITFDLPVEDVVQEAREVPPSTETPSTPNIDNDQLENHATPRRVRRRPAWTADYVTGEDIK